MATLPHLLVAERHHRVRGIVIWVGVFLLTLALVGVISAFQIDRSIDAAANRSLESFVALRANFLATLERLRAEVTAAPCSAEFRNQLRKIAYRPDGLNEFLYAPGGQVQCSVNVPHLDPPFALGPPDFITSTSTKVWLDRGLNFLGLNGLTGTIALNDPFAIVLPAQTIRLEEPAWMRTEVVAIAPDGNWWHRGGDTGIYNRIRHPGAQGNVRHLHRDVFHRLVCLDEGVHCAAAEVSLAGIVTQNPAPIALALLFAAAIAQSLTGAANRIIGNYWSFEARFRRHLDPDTIRCVYQPILELGTGKIVGCEVLARWRDTDGTIAMPDSFLAVVERHGLTALFTRLVIGCAFRELSDHVPADRRLEVTFNIFPRDLDAAWLRHVFAVFDAAPGRFALAVEIVENDMLPEKASAEIEALREAGIGTYIDDFGTAYANIRTLADLPVEGVKLDRSFALAPDDSLLANLLGHAIEMIRATGRMIVVEGVETAARMALLKDANVDRVQGFFVSKPLDIAAFAEFLEQYKPAVARDQRAA